MQAFIEPLCFVILALWLVLRFRREPAPTRGALLRELLVIAGAAFLGEMSCVRLYAFYAYSSVWRLYLDVVPVAVVCIWPVVIKSALDLTEVLEQRHVLRALCVAALVTVDAALIEPISVASGLWWWSEPGPFLVPVIGVVGWGFFAFGCAILLRGHRVSTWALAGAPLLTHALLLIGWWGGLRPLPRMESTTPWIAGAWIGCLAVSVGLWFRGVPIARANLWLRAPAAGFFFVLLALFSHEDRALVAWTLAFAPPWLVLLAGARRRVRVAG